MRGPVCIGGARLQTCATSRSGARAFPGKLRPRSSLHHDPVSADAELRIRLEGRLEVLEQSAAQLDRLLALARSGWDDEPRVLLDALDAWSEGAAVRHDAMRSAEREAGARRWL